jgi:phospholipid-transporting ATPase
MSRTRRYRRTTKLILYSFYKNMVVSFAQLWFGAHSQMSGLEVYESLMMSTVNLFWSSWPILIIAAFDRDATNDELHAYAFAFNLHECIACFPVFTFVYHSF